MFLTNPTRAKHFAAMVLIGDGVMAVVHPERDVEEAGTDASDWRSADCGWDLVGVEARR